MAHDSALSCPRRHACHPGVTRRRPSPAVSADTRGTPVAVPSVEGGRTMSFWGDAAATASDAWNGRSTMYGDAAATVAGVASQVPVFGALSPDAAEARACVDSLTGARQADPNAPGHIGNQNRTVAGAPLRGHRRPRRR